MGELLGKSVVMLSILLDRLNHIQFSKFKISLVSDGRMHLAPFQGSTIRGGFGYVFKKTVCALRGKKCDDCILREKCIYLYVFETPPPSDTRKMRKYPHAPHPFIIEPPFWGKRIYEKGDELEIGLILIGNAADYLPYFIYTFEELGKVGIGTGRGRYILERAKSYDGQGKWESIYDGKEKILRSNFKKISINSLTEGKTGTSSNSLLRLRFLTPTRIKFRESLTLDLEFHILIRNLLRRLSTLSYFHCGNELDLDYGGIIEHAKAVEVVERRLSWSDWERYSTRQNARMKLGGFIGDITFRGDLGEFLPLLLLGEQVHVGKGTSFGLGQFEIPQD